MGKGFLKIRQLLVWAMLLLVMGATNSAAAENWAACAKGAYPELGKCGCTSGEGLLRAAAKAGVVTDAQSVLAFLRERSSADLGSFLLKATEPAAAKGKR